MYDVTVYSRNEPHLDRCIGRDRLVFRDIVALSNPPSLRVTSLVPNSFDEIKRLFADAADGMRGLENYVFKPQQFKVQKWLTTQRPSFCEAIEYLDEVKIPKYLKLFLTRVAHKSNNSLVCNPTLYELVHENPLLRSVEGLENLFSLTEFAKGKPLFMVELIPFDNADEVQAVLLDFAQSLAEEYDGLVETLGLEKVRIPRAISNYFSD